MLPKDVCLAIVTSFPNSSLPAGLPASHGLCLRSSPATLCPGSKPGPCDLPIGFSAGSQLCFDRFSLPDPAQSTLEADELGNPGQLLTWPFLGANWPIYERAPRFPLIAGMNKNTATWGPLREGSVRKQT